MVPATPIQKIGQFFARPSVIIILIVVAVLVYVYLSGKKKGKETAAADIKEDLAVSVNTRLVTNNTGETYDPKPLTDNLYNDIYAGFWASRNEEPYEVLLAMSDDKFKMVHNDWLARYFDEDKETLKVAISNESIAKGGAISFSQLREQLLARFTNLGLK